MDKLTVILPWPPRECSPNRRVHWAARAKAARQYRRACWAITMQAAADWDVAELVAQAGGERGSIHLWLDYYPPDRRHRDDDNLIAATKAGRDGVAEALGIDDKLFRIHPILHEETCRGGQVVVTIEVFRPRWSRR